MNKRFAPPLVHLVSLCLVLCVLLVPEAPAQVCPPPWSPWGSWVSWSDVGDTCWASPGLHAGYPVLFAEGPTGPLHHFQGIYRVDDGSGTAHFYAVYPTPAEYDTLQELVIDCFPGANPGECALACREPVDTNGDGEPDYFVFHLHSVPTHVLQPQ